MDALKPFLTTISSGMTLSAAEATDAFETILAGEATPAQIGAFLMALRVRGETVEEITAGAKVMRRHALAVKALDNVRGQIDRVQPVPKDLRICARRRGASCACV